MSPDSTPKDVVDHITNVQQNYKPWYTAIQANIDAGKANASATITTVIGSFPSVIDKIEAKYKKTVKRFAARGCNTYDVYMANTQTKLYNVLSSISTFAYNYQMNVQQSIPSTMIYTLSNQLQNLIYPQLTSIPMLDLIKQVKIITILYVVFLHT